jgi:hypothetical protein
MASASDGAKPDMERGILGTGRVDITLEPNQRARARRSRIVLADLI